MYIFSLLCIITSFTILSCGTQGENTSMPPSGNTSYDLSSPSKQYRLPEDLKEISGIEYLGNNIVACIQDEKGIIYIYDLTTNSITQKINFSENGDYEDLRKVNDDYYILRSDGKVFIYNTKTASVSSINLEIKNDMEGICLDPKTNRLVLSGKKHPEIYSFQHTLQNSKPETHIEDLPEKFKPTALAFDPKGELLYVLATNQLGIFNREGKMTNQLPLNRALFPQPEGITFKENGDLLISNEAKGQYATILEFTKRDAPF